MIIIVYLIIMGIILDKKFKRDGKWNHEDDCGDVLPIYILTTMVGILLTLVLSSAVVGNNSRLGLMEYRTKMEYRLEALNDNISTNESFLGRSGINDNDISYVVVIHTEEGMKLKTYEIDNSYILYTEGQPKLNISTLEYKSPIMKFLLFNLHKRRYTFHIPENSIVSDYTIDLK